MRTWAHLVQSQATFLDLDILLCPLSLWERVRMRGFVPGPAGPLTPRPLPWGEGASGKVVLFELAVQRRQADIQNAGGNLPIASMPLQRLHNSCSFNLGEGSIGG